MLTTEQIKAMDKKAQEKGKEFFYWGFYIDYLGNIIWKPGTAAILWRRKKQHDRDYLKSTCNHRMMEGTEFHYLWAIPLAKWTTRKVEESTIDRLRAENFGEYILNDRFVDVNHAESVNIIIRKTYTIPLCAI